MELSERVAVDQVDGTRVTGVSAQHRASPASPTDAAVSDVSNLVEADGPRVTAEAHQAGQHDTFADPSQCCQQLSGLGVHSNLAVAVVQLRGAAQVPLHSRVDASLCTCNPGGTNYSGSAAIGIRGSSSSREGLKRSYSLVTLHKDGSKHNVPLLGLPADHEWVLYGPENDRTLGMRNVLAYDVGRAMGRYAFRTRVLELFIMQDGQNLSYLAHYWGVYVLEEKIKRGRQRVDVAHMTPDDDISGGYILGYENDKISANDTTFTLRVSHLRFVLHYPKLSSTHSASRERVIDWIARFMDKVELSFQPDSGRDWRDLVEPGAFVDYLLATELTKNPDGYRGSVYMSKDRGGKLQLGPMWDYNEAFGLCCGYPIDGYLVEGLSNGTSGGSAVSPNGWRFTICDEPQRCREDAKDGISSWFRQAWQEPQFRREAHVRWSQLRTSALADGALTARVEDLKAQLGAGAAMRNYVRWAEAVHSPQYFPDDLTQWTYEVTTLHQWLLHRAAWMDWALQHAEQHPVPIGALPAWRYKVVEVADDSLL